MRFSRLICWTPSQCEEAERFLLRCILIANDIETFPFKKKNKTPVFTMTVNAYTGLTADGEIRSFAFPFQQSKHPASGAPTHTESIYHTCRRINASGIPFTGHNYPYDLAWLIRYLMPVANYAYDSMTMWWSRYPELPKTLDFVSSILLDHYQYWKMGRKEDDFTLYMHYGMSDTESTLLNTIIMIEWLIEDSATRKNFWSAHKRCIAGLSMSMKGIKVNVETMNQFDEDLTAIAEEKLKRLRYLVADSDFNPNSPPQKKELIYGLLGARKRNAKGRFVSKESDASTGAIPLRAMRNDHPLFRRVANGILDAIEPAKQLSNVVGLAFLDGKPPAAPRFLTAYHGVGTVTTRFSSSGHAFGHGGNAQNIRKKYRSFGEADEDSFLLEIDYSSADDVFVSFESQEPKKIELVRSGKDIHGTNALIFFENWTYDGIVAGKKAGDPAVVHPITGVRQITKKVVHGNHYLMAGLTLLMSAGREAIVAAAKEAGYADAGYWSQDRLVKYCEHLEKKFRNHYPRFKRKGDGSWYTELQEEVIRTRGFLTIFNYFERFLGNPYDDAILRGVSATAGQASTAGRINMAMEELLFGTRILDFRDGPAPDRDDPPRIVTEAEHGVSIRLQTHDSITFNIRHTHPNWRDGVDSIFHVMSRPVLCKGEVFSVGLEAEASYRWAGKESVEVKSAADIEENFLRKVNRASIYRDSAKKAVDKPLVIS